MASNDDMMGGLGEEIEDAGIAREKRVEGIYERLCEAGIDPGKQKKREMLARKLEAQGMSPADMEMLVAHAHAKESSLENWRGLLASFLKDPETWMPLVKDLKRTKASMDKRAAEVAKRRAGGTRDYVSTMPLNDRIFYAFFYDQRPKEEIARAANMTPTQVLEIFEKVARDGGIPEKEIQRRLKWAERPEAEYRGDVQPEAPEPVDQPVFGE